MEGQNRLRKTKTAEHVRRRRNADHSMRRSDWLLHRQGREYISLHRPACSDLVFCVDSPLERSCSPGAGQSSTGRLQAHVGTLETLFIDNCY